MFFQFCYICYVYYGIWVIFVVRIGKRLYDNMFVDGCGVKVIGVWEVNDIDFLFVFEYKFFDFFIDGNVWKVVYFLLQFGKLIKE